VEEEEEAAGVGEAWVLPGEENAMEGRSGGSASPPFGTE